MNSISDTAILNDRVEMPYLGLGTYQLISTPDITNAVIYALDMGYRHIDTAEMYNNESFVADGIRQTNVARQDIFITTKVWPNHFGYNKTINACEKSLQRLNTDYIDLYLLHWPSPVTHYDAWEALIELKKRGLCRSIGVSNFNSEQIQRLIDQSDVVPSVNQVEFHPFNFKKKIMDYCQSRNIFLEAYSPLARGRRFDHTQIKDLSRKYKKTPAQIFLRWSLQHNVIVIPKSQKKEHIKENAGIFDFQISEKDMQVLNSLDEGYSVI